MIVQTSCANCGKTGSVPAQYLGRTVGCKRCHRLFKVRAARAPRPEPVLVLAGGGEEDKAWLNDMPPILVDLPCEQVEQE